MGHRVNASTEQPIGPVRGTRDWLPNDHRRLAALERALLDHVAAAGFEPMRTPILERTELHARKSGAGIVSKLFELPGEGPAAGLCLRPELTASIVLAYAKAEGPPPWRVCMAGPVFRYEPAPDGERLREFTQVGVELLGLGGPDADAEVIHLACSALTALGINDARARIGHVGLILELLERSGLPPAATAALVDVLSEAASTGGTVQALESVLDRLAHWLRPDHDAEALAPAVERADDGSVDRLFRHLVPDVTGRRTGHEIMGRLKRKWEMGHSLADVIARARDQLQALANLRGPARDVLDRINPDVRALAPQSIRELRELLDRLEARGTPGERLELDLGFGRGIGFYTQMIFEIVVPVAARGVEVCGGGRYDGLARVLGSDRDDRGVGFAFGLERLLNVLDDRARAASEPPLP